MGTDDAKQRREVCLFRVMLQPRVDLKVALWDIAFRPLWVYAARFERQISYWEKVQLQ